MVHLASYHIISRHIISYHVINLSFYVSYFPFVVMTNIKFTMYVQMIWDLVSGLCVMTLSGHTRAVRTVIQLSDGRICSGGADNKLVVWK